MCWPGTRRYFDVGSTSSVYMFNTDEKDDDSFGACFLVHKGPGASPHGSAGHAADLAALQTLGLRRA